VLLQSDAFLWAYSSLCPGSASGISFKDAYALFNSRYDEVLGGAKGSVSKDLLKSSLELDKFIQYLRAAETAKAGGATEAITRYCAANRRRFTALSQAQTTGSLETLICR